MARAAPSEEERAEQVRQKRQRGTPWLAPPTSSKGWAERFFLIYSPVWMLQVAAVVVLQLWQRFDGLGYFLFGAWICLPIVVVPLLFPGKADQARPLTERYWFKAFAWTVLFSFIGNHFLTHYFFNVLGCWYTVPTDGWEVNGIPLVMHLLTVAYFISYHTLASALLRRTAFFGRTRSLFSRMLQVGAMAYITAVLEAYSISAFPHYRYPDMGTMLLYGSAFYALMFLITYPAYALLDEFPATTRSLGGFLEHSLACGMAVFILDDAWRLLLGPVVDIPPERQTYLPYAQAPQN